MDPDDVLTVDLTDTVIESTDDLWDRLARPCGLPAWFGRNLDAWEETIRGNVSEILDSHSMVVIRARGRGLFAPDNDRGKLFRQICEESGRARVELVDST